MITDDVFTVTMRLLKRCGDLSYSQAWEAACRVMLMRREVDRLHRRQLRRQREMEALAYEAERTRMLCAKICADAAEEYKRMARTCRRQDRSAEHAWLAAADCLLEQARVIRGEQ